MHYTSEQLTNILRVITDYRTARDGYITRFNITQQHHDMAFMRMCNEYALQLDHATQRNFGEIAAWFTEIHAANLGNPFGVDSQWLALEPANREALEELLGCLLGIKRAG